MSRFSHLELGASNSGQEIKTASTDRVAEYMDRGLADFRRCRFADALRAYSRVLEFEPQHLEAWVSQAKMMIELGDLAGARNWIERSEETFPNALPLQALRVKVLARLKDTAAAFPFSDAMVESDQESAVFWSARMEALLAKGDKLADYCVTRAQAIAPEDGDLEWGLSRSFAHFEVFAKALKHANRAIEIESSYPVHWWQKGECERQLGLKEPARQSYERAIELDPVCESAQQGLLALRNIGFASRVWAWMNK